MSTDDLFRARLDTMIDLRHPLAVLAERMPWTQIEAALAPALAHRDRQGNVIEGADLFGPTVQLAGAGVSPRGRKRLAIRLMVCLLYLKHAFNLSDEELVQRWSENVQWQFFSGMVHFEPRLPCDATQIGRFRKLIGEAGVEEILKVTIDTAVTTKAVRPGEFERVIVDTTVQEKAVAHPVDSRLLEIARARLVQASRRCGIALKQTFAKEGKELRRKAGGYAHAKQFKRLRRAVKRQRTILGIVIREIGRKHDSAIDQSPLSMARLATLLERAERIWVQQPRHKGKLYALHAPEVECIGKGKASKPYEFGVEASIAVTHRSGLMVGARTFPGNPYDGHILSAQLEQTGILLQDTGKAPTQVVVDLGFRGVDQDNPGGADHPPGQVQVADERAAALAEKTPGGGAGHRASQERSPHGSVLVARAVGRCAARGAVRGGVQPALADARGAALGPEGFFIAPLAERRVAAAGGGLAVRGAAIEHGAVRGRSAGRGVWTSLGCRWVK